jgi:hypothetical protein
MAARDCDRVIKGGITRGVIYPKLVSTLSRRIAQNLHQTNTDLCEGAPRPAPEMYWSRAPESGVQP